MPEADENERLVRIERDGANTDTQREQQDQEEMETLLIHYTTQITIDTSTAYLLARPTILAERPRRRMHQDLSARPFH